MVSTRGHLRDFSEPDLTPTKPTPSHARAGRWAHTPSNLAIGWLLLSLPLVTWDTGYVLLRPHTMPGGKLQWPLYIPYELYGRVDYIYGWKAFNENNGFTSAQGMLNILETLMYVYYLYILFAFGKQSTKAGRGAPKPSTVGFLGQQCAVEGQAGALAVLVGYSAAVMTVSKTVLYWLNEYYSGFANIGHNSLRDLIVLWILPNGAWLVFPSYMIYLTGSEIVEGLTIAAGTATSSADGRSLRKSE
ncbi:hypothetical protein D0Z07_6357 [Hyphodiscus hymeniophilus]|uniref:C6 transcription factor n=1 Tax=Hyphodiscus hymeniophilus TaxID=353542 RepID=A0A9P7AUF6_9HELO|nr:hypothetical protein D0Z07_6357 [Hyphodiscus hymeniophilus]